MITTIMVERTPVIENLTTTVAFERTVTVYPRPTTVPTSTPPSTTRSTVGQLFPRGKT
jgi:hypothetical protein